MKIFAPITSRLDVIITLLKEGNEDLRRLTTEVREARNDFKVYSERPIEDRPPPQQAVATMPKSWGRFKRELEIADFERAVREREGQNAFKER